MGSAIEAIGERLRHDCPVTRMSALQVYAMLAEKPTTINAIQKCIEEDPSIGKKDEAMSCLLGIIAKGDKEAIPIICAYVQIAGAESFTPALEVLRIVASNVSPHEIADMIALLEHEVASIRKFALQAYVLFAEGDEMTATLRRRIEEDTDEGNKSEAFSAV